MCLVHILKAVNPLKVDDLGLRRPLKDLEEGISIDLLYRALDTTLTAMR